MKTKVNYMTLVRGRLGWFSQRRDRQNLSKAYGAKSPLWEPPFKKYNFPTLRDVDVKAIRERLAGDY